MSKVVDATCVAGVVTAEGVAVPIATVFSEGVASSTGVLIIDGDKAWYVSKTTPDLKTTIEKLVNALTQIKTALDQTVQAVNNAGSGLTLCDAKPTGGAGSAVTPVTVASVAAITTAAVQVSTAATAIDLIKTELNTLKGALK